MEAKIQSTSERTRQNKRKETAVTIRDEFEAEIEDSGLPHSRWCCGISATPWSIGAGADFLRPVPGTLKWWDAGDELSARFHELLARQEGCEVRRHPGDAAARFFFIYLLAPPSQN